MTPSRDEAGRPQNESGTPSTATGFAVVKKALTTADEAHNLADDQPGATDSTVSASSGAAVSTGQRAVRVPEGTANGPVARGDVRVIEPLPWLEGRRRLAVVRRVDADRDVAELMLAHPWPELATDTDAVIAGDHSGLPFPLVVECYVRNPVWLLQVRERSGALTKSLMDAIGSAVIDRDRTVEGVQTGMPLAGPADPRWHFKEEEVVEWRALTNDCAVTLLDNDDAWPLDADRLQPHSYGETSGSQRDHLRLEETVHLLTTRHIAVELPRLRPGDTSTLNDWAEFLGRDRRHLLPSQRSSRRCTSALSQWDAEADPGGCLNHALLSLAIHRVRELQIDCPRARLSSSR